MKRRYSPDKTRSNNKRQKGQWRQEVEELPFELWTHEIMGHLAQEGHVKELARLALTCKRLYTSPWRSLCKRITQYIPHWTQETFAPFVPFVEEMLWVIATTSRRPNWKLNFQACHSLKRLHMMKESARLYSDEFNKEFLPLELEELIVGPNLSVFMFTPRCFPPNLKRIGAAAAPIFAESTERLDNGETRHVADRTTTSTRIHFR